MVRSRFFFLFPIALALAVTYFSGAQERPPGLLSSRPPDGRFVETRSGFMIPYSATIPGTNVRFYMEPIPGGEFTIGSPENEVGRSPDESTFRVQVQPFWMARYEITWAEYKQYMALHDLLKEMASAKVRPAVKKGSPDVITAPSNLYDPTFTYAKGSDPSQPAITMSQYAAKQYTKWLSRTSGVFYRLPSEAEWEYACRAGSNTAYYFGDDPTQLGDYAWNFDNSGEKPHLVGQKKPNAWMLFDMHGNVAEWVLDEFTVNRAEALLAKFPNGAANGARSIQWPTKLYPRIVKGGSWDDHAPACRSAARKGSHDDEWRAKDPNFPPSPWWFTDGYALGVGFRIVRPLDPPSNAEEEEVYWRADTDLVQGHVDYRIDEEGRGARGKADPTLPVQAKEYQSKK